MVAERARRAQPPRISLTMFGAGQQRQHGKALTSVPPSLHILLPSATLHANAN